MPSPLSRLSLRLHAALTLNLMNAGASIIDMSLINGPVPVKQYTIQFTHPSQILTLQYTGNKFHQLCSQSNNHAVGRNSSPGLISPEGVFLSGSSYWYPQFKEQLLSFSLSVALPGGWTSVSQGKENSSPVGRSDQQLAGKSVNMGIW